MSSEKKRFAVGGQAVIEGVMMRSEHAFTVAVRRLQTGEIVVRSAPWRPVWERMKFLRLPVLRGGIVLVETLYNGLTALSFSANEAVKNEQGGKKEELTPFALTMTIISSFLMAFFFFVIVPHAATWGIGFLAGSEGLKGGRDFSFHAVDGLIKVLMFVAFVWSVSKMKEIHRVFQYHGAEHKSIHAYENGCDLTVENARRFPTLHPRCGTSFIIMVVIISILFFAVFFPLMPRLSETAWLNHLIYLFIKLLLIVPIAGLSYEAIKVSEKYKDSVIGKVVSFPGLMIQKITTKEPNDRQIEVALSSLLSALTVEKGGELVGERIEVFGGFGDFLEKNGRQIQKT